MTGRVLILVGVMLSAAFITGCRMKSDMNLKKVKVSASTVYCLFDPSCAVAVTNSSTVPIPMEILGKAVVESRTFAGKPGTPAAGLYGYEYRIDLEQGAETVVEVEEFGKVKYMPCLSSIIFDFGPIVDTLDYNGDGQTDELIYVVSQGGPGKASLGFVQRFHGRLTFNFDSPICVGGQNHPGDSTFFFGLVSTKPPRLVDATIKETAGLGAASPKMKKNIKYHVDVYAPQIDTEGSKSDRSEGL